MDSKQLLCFLERKSSKRFYCSPFCEANLRKWSCAIVSDLKARQFIYLTNFTDDRLLSAFIKQNAFIQMIYSVIAVCPSFRTKNLESGSRRSFHLIRYQFHCNAVEKVSIWLRSAKNSQWIKIIEVKIFSSRLKIFSWTSDVQLLTGTVQSDSSTSSRNISFRSTNTHRNKSRILNCKCSDISFDSTAAIAQVSHFWFQSRLRKAFITIRVAKVCATTKLLSCHTQSFPRTDIVLKPRQ